MNKTRKTLKNKKLIKRRQNEKRTRQTATTKKTHQTHKSKTQLIITSLLKLQAQIKFLHWNTKKYAIHMISDKFHEKLSGHIDELIEVLLAQGVKLRAISKYYENTKDLSTPATTYEAEKESTLKTLDKTIYTINNNSRGMTRDVSAVLDVVITDINRFKYLLSFK